MIEWHRPPLTQGQRRNNPDLDARFTVLALIYGPPPPLQPSHLIPLAFRMALDKVMGWDTSGFWRRGSGQLLWEWAVSYERWYRNNWGVSKVLDELIEGK